MFGKMVIISNRINKRLTTQQRNCNTLPAYISRIQIEDTMPENKKKALTASMCSTEATFCISWARIYWGR